MTRVRLPCNAHGFYSNSFRFVSTLTTTVRHEPHSYYSRLSQTSWSLQTVFRTVPVLLRTVFRDSNTCVSQRRRRQKIRSVLARPKKKNASSIYMVFNMYERIPVNFVCITFSKILHTLCTEMIIRCSVRLNVIAAYTNE